jgi:hypothetical protein
MQRDPGAWFRQPVVWLGALILAASIAGCVVMIVLAMRFPDPPFDSHGGRAMNAPLQRSADATPPAPNSR